VRQVWVVLAHPRDDLNDREASAAILREPPLTAPSVATADGQPFRARLPFKRGHQLPAPLAPSLMM
jgi:hypothetical protein